MPTPAQITHFFDFSARQLKRLVETHPDRFPMYTTGGRWNFSGESWTNWCEGFLGGQLWLLHQHTGDPFWRARAEHYSRHLAPRRTDRTVHDLGFLFWPTWKRWYDLTGDPAHQRRGDRGRANPGAALQRKRPLPALLPGRRQPVHRHHDERGHHLLRRRAAHRPATCCDIATQHCLTTRRYLVRGDGSTAHEGIFDLQTGEFLRQSTQQGWRADSSWARGLAWALYGFGTVYQHTRTMGAPTRAFCKPPSCARSITSSTPRSTASRPTISTSPTPSCPTKAPPRPSPPAASSTWPSLAPDPARAQSYHDYACRILDTLLTPEFLASETPGWEGLLKHGMYHPAQRSGGG